MYLVLIIFDLETNDRFRGNYYYPCRPPRASLAGLSFHSFLSNYCRSVKTNCVSMFNITQVSHSIHYRKGTKMVFHVIKWFQLPISYTHLDLIADRLIGWMSTYLLSIRPPIIIFTFYKHMSAVNVTPAGSGMKLCHKIYYTKVPKLILIWILIRCLSGLLCFHHSTRIAYGFLEPAFTQKKYTCKL